MSKEMHSTRMFQRFSTPSGSTLKSNKLLHRTFLTTIAKESVSEWYNLYTVLFVVLQIIL